jgi:transcriptional regulator with XRE-family HTH domain
VLLWASRPSNENLGFRSPARSIFLIAAVFRRTFARQDKRRYRDGAAISRFYLTSTVLLPQITPQVWNQVPSLVRFSVPSGSPLWPLPNLMATTLAPVDSREVVRCDRCLLVQFRTTNNLCRRCHGSLDEDEPEIVSAPPPPQVIPSNGHSHGHLHLATAIRSIRLGSGLSQRQLAARMSVPRTYVSKIENEKATPTLSSLERLAKALEVTVPDLLSGGERNRQQEVRELMQDPFIAEILPFVAQLNGMQMSSILTQVRDLTVRPRRTA